MLSKRVAQTVAVGGVLWVLITAIPHISLAFNGDPGDIGLTTDYDGYIRADATGKGLAGKVIVYSRLGFADRYVTTPARPPVQLNVSHCIPIAKRASCVNVTTQPYFGNIVSSRVDLMVRGVATAILMILAGIALTRAPTRSNLDLFVFCVGANPIALNARLSRMPTAGVWLVYVIVIDVLAALALVAIVDFAVHGQYRSAFERLWNRALPFVIVSFCVIFTWPDVATSAFGTPSERLNRVGYLYAILLAAYGLIALGFAATQSPRILRSAAVLKTAIYAVGVGGYIFANLLMYTSVFKTWPTQVEDALQSLSLLLFVFIMASGIIDKAANFASSRRSVVISIAVDVLFAAAWSPITNLAQKLQNRNHLTWLDGAVGVGLLVVGVMLNRPIDAAVAKYADKRDEVPRSALLSAAAKLGDASTIDTLDRSVAFVAEYLDLAFSIVYRKIGDTYSRVSSIRLQGSPLQPPEALVLKVEEGAFFRSEDGFLEKASSANIFPIATRSVIGFVATGDRRDMRALSKADVDAIEVYVARAGAVYASLQSPTHQPPVNSLNLLPASQE